MNIAQLDLDLFLKQLDYSASTPTGKWPGKTWRRWVGRHICKSGWWLGMWGDEHRDSQGNYFDIHWFEIVIDTSAVGIALPGFGAYLYQGCWSVWSEDTLNDGFVLARDRDHAITALLHLHLDRKRR
jgi:hypothetical protein